MRSQCLHVLEDDVYLYHDIPGSQLTVGLEDLDRLLLAVPCDDEISLAISKFPSVGVPP